MSSNREPTMRAAWLGQELRDLRESKSITVKEISTYLNKAQSSVSRLESGVHPARETDVTAYLDICGVRDKRRRDDLVKMCDEVVQLGWWAGYEADVANTLMDRMWIEERTTHIDVCDVTYIPGLLQTPEYARAMFQTANPNVTSKEVQRWLSFRSTRQHIINRYKPVELRCILDEYLLRRTTGDREVMRDQLDHLLESGGRPNIEVRVLPGDTCSGITGPFEVLELTSPYPRVGYVTTAAGDICVEGQQVDALVHTYDRLMKVALSPEASRERISQERSRL